MFKDIKKYVINLKRRPDRLVSVLKEFEYMGIDVEVFEGIDTNSFVGATDSHKEIIKLAKKNNLKDVIVFEDDIMFMPYAKSLIRDIELELRDIKYGTLNLNPAFHRPVNLSTISELLLDITNLPPKDDNHREVFGAGFMVYNESVYDEILECPKSDVIDEYLSNFIYPKYQSYSPIIPIACSTNGISNVSQVYSKTYFIQTYNWNVYCPNKISQSYYYQEYVENLKKNNDELDYKKILKHV